MTTTTPKPRRMARMPDAAASADADADAPAPAPALAAAASRNPSKLDQVASLLSAPEGATIAEIMACTGWQQHSVRGAMAGALKKRGLIITSQKIDGVRRYRAERSA
jgi:hypothetical protein